MAFDDELSRFLGQAEEDQHRQEHLEETVERLKLFLEERGIMFDNPDSDDRWYMDDKKIAAVLSGRINDKKAELGRQLTQDEEEEIKQRLIDEAKQLIDARAERHNNTTWLIMLAARLVILESLRAVEPTHQPRPDLKKRLQAESILHDFSGPWVGLIDKEFPGEPLKPEDTELFAEVAAESILKGDEEIRKFEDLRTQMKSFLSQEGIDEFTPEAEMAILRLCSLKQDAERMQQFGEDANLIKKMEDARIILAEYDLTDPAWHELVDNFFNQP